LHPATSAAIELFLVVDDETAHECVAAASATVAAHFHYLDTIADWLAGRGIATSA
jgi:pyrroline-5-carboxylate reductase